VKNNSYSGFNKVNLKKDIPAPSSEDRLSDIDGFSMEESGEKPSNPKLDGKTQARKKIWT
jgi:hypothetical protein